MQAYSFCDTDIYGNEEYDIAGEEYEALIKACCKYSSVLSLKFFNKSNPFYDELLQYKIKSTSCNEKILKNLEQFEEIVYYRVCPELCSLLLKITDSMFKWIDGWGFENPEDPCFYREDGTELLVSSIHEGIVKIMLRENEDVSQIIANPLWTKEA